ncbi:hypothetical protein D9619_008006 [Psilocybe cf. subviscida]|uniref:Uncharacterized protein n=1 Tax=Psilocybe cf. subviscida TaxID=2480587 RepID=A0A8H5ESL1_9AGAR|nr:hypothetical protein D9619_008006 [Psilocybe cf. subviscida]
MASRDNTAPDTLLSDKYPNAYRDFYPGPACIYKTGPDWPARQDGGDWGYGYPLRREARPVYNHPITAKWLLNIGERIFKHLDFLHVSWSSINPLAYAVEVEAKPFCPLLISIGVTPNSLPYDAAYAAAHDSKGILVEEGFPDIEVAIVESASARYSGTSSDFLMLTPNLWPGVRDLVRPFTALLGVPIALLDHPDLGGTGGLVFHLGKDSGDKPIIGLLTCAHVALPSTVYGTLLKSGCTMDKVPRIEYIALGEAGYKEVVEAMDDVIEGERNDIKVWTDAALKQEEASLAGDREEGQSCKGPAQKRRGVEEEDVTLRIDSAQRKISRVEALRTEVRNNRATPSQRLLGSLLYSAPLRVSLPDQFASDWAMIAIDQSKIHQFAGNGMYIGDLKKTDFCRLLYSPEQAESTNLGMYPAHGLLQVTGVVEDDEIRNPRTLDEHGEPCLLAIKNGASTGTTIGRVNGIESFVRTFAGDEEVTTREIAVVGYRRHHSHYIPRFSHEGDSGAIVVSRDGRIVGLLNGGNPGRTDISFITPYWWLERQIKEHIVNNVGLVFDISNKTRLYPEFKTGAMQIQYNRFGIPGRTSQPPFPANTKGMFYYKQSAIAPTVIGELRFRLCDDISSFDVGKDLCLPSGLPWYLPSDSILTFPTHNALLVQLFEEGLLRPAAMSFVDKHGTAILHGLRQPFALNIGETITTICFNTGKEEVKHQMRCLFTNGRDSGPLYTGRAVVQFEKYPLEDIGSHAKHKPLFALRFLEFLTPVTKIAHQDSAMVQHLEPGQYLKRRTRAGVYQTWGYTPYRAKTQAALSEWAKRSLVPEEGP